MHAQAEGESHRIDCRDPAALKLQRGPVPSEHLVVVRMRIEADRPVPLWMFEQAVRERAARYCSAGVSLLRAEASAGAEGYLTVDAAGWRTRPTPTEVTPPEREPAHGP